MNRARSGVKVARALHDAEHAIDNAMKATSVLIHDMLEARADARLAAEAGQDALSDVISGLSALNGARERVVSGHTALGILAETTNVGWRLEGPMEEKVKPAGFTPLAVVA